MRQAFRGHVGPTKIALDAEDYQVLDDAEFSAFLDWDHRRTSGEGHLGEYSVRQLLDYMHMLKCYCLRLRARLAECKNAKRLSELEQENARLEVRLANQGARLDRVNRLREENQSLRRLLDYHRRRGT